jgi:hypothetical protein
VNVNFGHPTMGEARGRPYSPVGGLFVAFLPSRPLIEVGLPHDFSKQLSYLSSVEPQDTKICAPLHRFRVGFVT